MKYNPNFHHFDDQASDFQQTFLDTTDAVTLQVYLPADMLQAEENPDQAEALREFIRYATLQEGSDWVIYQHYSSGPILRRDTHPSSMEKFAAMWPSQFEFPTQEELEEQLNESPTDAECYYENLDHVVHVANNPDDRSRQLLMRRWLILPSIAVPGQSLLWVLDDGECGLAFEGRFKTEQEAFQRIADEKSGMAQMNSQFLCEAQEELRRERHYLKAERPSRHEPSEARDRVAELETTVKFLKASIRTEARSTR